LYVSAFPKVFYHFAVKSLPGQVKPTRQASRMRIIHSIQVGTRAHMEGPWGCAGSCFAGGTE
jgi:hypothetical protein